MSPFSTFFRTDRQKDRKGKSKCHIPSYNGCIIKDDESMIVVKGQTSIKICSINPRCVKKIKFFFDYIISNDLDLVALMETWLGTSFDKECINEKQPPGYLLVRATEELGFIYKSY